MASDIGRDKALELLLCMVRIRRLEDAAAELYGKGVIRGFLHLCHGEEAVAAGVMDVLKPDDRVLSTYREHGHALARGLDASVILAELAGKQQGCCGGRGGSMHLFDVRKNFFGGTAIVAGHLPMAAGIALADKRLGTDRITVCLFGEGAAAEGIFHETMNLSALWQVPVLFVVENNLYAMGTSIDRTFASTNLEQKFQAYGIEARTTDGMDVSAVRQHAGELVAMVRTVRKPAALICNTFRFRGHSMFDAELYRDKAEVEIWKQRDPIQLWRKHAEQSGWLTESEWNTLTQKADAEITAAVTAALAGTAEPVDTLENHLYAGTI